MWDLNLIISTVQAYRWRLHMHDALKRPPSCALYPGYTARTRVSLLGLLWEVSGLNKYWEWRSISAPVMGRCWGEPCWIWFKKPLWIHSDLCALNCSSLDIYLSLGLSTTWSQNSRSQHRRGSCSRHEDRKPSEVFPEWWCDCACPTCVHENIGLAHTWLVEIGAFLQSRASYLTCASVSKFVRWG